jgi:hypothetical protein
LLTAGLEYLQTQNEDYYQSLGLDPTVQNELSTKFSSGDLLAEALGELQSEEQQEYYGSPMKSEKSVRIQEDDRSPSSKTLKPVRSARSFGLKSNGSFSIEQLAKEIGDQLESSTGSSKGLKTQLSFVLSTKNTKVDETLKPKSPYKKKSISGFQMLKEGAEVLRKGRDENNRIWIEYQSAEEGPIFYALENSNDGQWKPPAVFISLEIEEPHELDTASETIHPARKGKGDTIKVNMAHLIVIVLYRGSYYTFRNII